MNTELLTIEVMYGIVAVVYTTELFGNGRFCLSATLSLPCSTLLTAYLTFEPCEEMCFSSKIQYAVKNPEWEMAWDVPLPNCLLQQWLTHFSLWLGSKGVPRIYRSRRHVDIMREVRENI